MVKAIWTCFKVKWTGTLFQEGSPPEIVKQRAGVPPTVSSKYRVTKTYWFAHFQTKIWSVTFMAKGDTKADKPQIENNLLKETSKIENTTDVNGKRSLVSALLKPLYNRPYHWNSDKDKPREIFQP